MSVLICLLGERPANRLALQDYEKGWTTLVATSCLPTLLSQIATSRPTSAGKMSPACYPVTEGEISLPSSKVWRNSGMGGRTECLTLSSAEHMASPSLSPNVEGVCSLSDVLETRDVPQRYFLTARACSGILRRAEKRGKQLPEQLALALRAVAGSAQTLT